MLGQARKNFAVQVGLVGLETGVRWLSRVSLTLRLVSLTLSQLPNPAVPGNFSVLGDMMKKKKKKNRARSARSAPQARRRRGAQARRAKAPLEISILR